MLSNNQKARDVSGLSSFPPSRSDSGAPLLRYRYWQYHHTDPYRGVNGEHCGVIMQNTYMWQLDKVQNSLAGLENHAIQ